MTDVQLPIEQLVEAEKDRRAGGVRRWLTVARSALLVPILAMVAGLVVGAIAIAATAEEARGMWTSAPGSALTEAWYAVRDAYVAMAQGSLGDTAALRDTVFQSTPLILVGLAASLSFRAGVFNIGAQGQILLGAFAAVWVGTSLDGLNVAIHLTLVVLAGIAGGALWGLLPGVLKARAGANEVITTLMLNFVAINLVSYLLLQDFLRRPGRQEPISKQVPAGLMFGHTTIGLLIALLAAFAVWWFLFRSVKGFEVRMVGDNASAATYAGISVGSIYILVMVLSGGLAGLAAVTMLLGNQGFVVSSFAGSYGFDAITVAILGRLDPRGVVFASFLLGILRAGAIAMQAETSVSPDMVVIVQAVIIVFMASPYLIRALFHVRDVGMVRSFSKGWAA
jgi:simple sugar transport system permease protein